MNMKKIIFGLVLAFLGSIAEAKDIQLFNPDIFGQPISTAIKTLQDKKSDETEPVNILLDIKCGKYYAASVFYPKKVTLAEARESLNRLYKNYETLSLLKESSLALWRVEDKRFAIQLGQEEDRIRIIYIQFQPTKTVMKDILKSKDAETDILEDNECKE